MNSATSFGNLLSRYSLTPLPQFSQLPGAIDPQGVAGQNNAAMGQGQGANGIPNSFAGATLGGNPATAQRSILPTTGRAPQGNAMRNTLAPARPGGLAGMAGGGVPAAAPPTAPSAGPAVPGAMPGQPPVSAAPIQSPIKGIMSILRSLG